MEKKTTFWWTARLHERPVQILKASLSQTSLTGTFLNIFLIPPLLIKTSVVNMGRCSEFNLPHSSSNSSYRTWRSANTRMFVIWWLEGDRRGDFKIGDGRMRGEKGERLQWKRSEGVRRTQRQREKCVADMLAVTLCSHLLFDRNSSSPGEFLPSVPPPSETLQLPLLHAAPPPSSHFWQNPLKKEKILSK